MIFCEPSIRCAYMIIKAVNYLMWFTVLMGKQPILYSRLPPKPYVASITNRVKRMNNRTYIIGRHGNIQMFDRTTSARHAELVVLNDDLYLTDLDSTNGTYIVENGQRKRFKEGYININQTIAFGNHVCSVRELVARAQLCA